MNQSHTQEEPMGNDRKKFRPKMQGPKDSAGSANQGLGGPRTLEDCILEHLQSIGGPTFDLASLSMSEKKFSGHNRLYVGNLPADTTEDELSEMFKKFGDTGEIFINEKKNFGFIRLDYYANAEKARREINGMMHKGRMLKVRFASNGATLKVKNLTQWVTNELLHVAFSIFGEIERCVIIVDIFGKTTGEGIVEFAKKHSATSALKHCSEECFFLSSSLRPVIVESYEQMDVIDGYPEKSLKKKNEYYEAREIGPRFANPGSFEHEYGTRWKQLHELYKQKQKTLKQELAMEEDKLEAQMQYAKFENETEMLRKQLHAREMDRERQKREWEKRERIIEEQCRRNKEQIRLKQEEIQMRIHNQEENVHHRQQENSLFMQAHQLSNMLDQQEQIIQSYCSPTDIHLDFEQGRQEEQPPMDSKSFISKKRIYTYEDMSDVQVQSPREYPNKRRRYYIDPDRT